MNLAIIFWKAIKEQVGIYLYVLGVENDKLDIVLRLKILKSLNVI